MKNIFIFLLFVVLLSLSFIHTGKSQNQACAGQTYTYNIALPNSCAGNCSNTVNYGTGISSANAAVGGGFVTVRVTYADVSQVTSTYFSVTIQGCGGSSGTAGGCQHTTNPTSVTVYPIPPVTISPINPEVCPSDIQVARGGSVTPTANTTGSYLYSWSPATGLSSTTGQSVSASPSQTTTYTVTGTNIAGCVTQSSVTVRVPVVNLTASATSIVCGQSVTLTTSGASSYAWSEGSSTSSSITVSPEQTTTYIVWGTTNGCIISKEVKVSVIGTQIYVNPSSYSVCAGEPVTLTVQGEGIDYSQVYWPATGQYGQSIVV